LEISVLYSPGEEDLVIAWRGSDIHYFFGFVYQNIVYKILEIGKREGT